MWLPDDGFMWAETFWISFYNFNHFNNLRIFIIRVHYLDNKVFDGIIIFRLLIPRTKNGFLDKICTTYLKAYSSGLLSHGLKQTTAYDFDNLDFNFLFPFDKE